MGERGPVVRRQEPGSGHGTVTSGWRLPWSWELFVASPLMPSFAGTGAMEESTASIVAALLRCDEGCAIAQPGLCPPYFQCFRCGIFLLGSDPPLVAAPDFAFLVSIGGLSHFF